MTPEKMHLRHCMLYEYFQQKNATEATKAICSVYGQDALSVRSCQFWFARFKSGDYTIEDGERSGRPKNLENDELKELIEDDPRLSTYDLSTILGVTQSTIHRRLLEMGKVNKVGKWVPHDLTDHAKLQRLNTSLWLLSKYKKKDFLWKIVTGDEKWVYLSNPHKKKQWLSPGQKAIPTPKREPDCDKLMLCVWWDMKGIIHYELLEDGQKVNRFVYSEQLRRLNQKIIENRPWNGNGNRKVLLLHDNAKPHTAILTRDTIFELGWEVMPHPAYSPDLAPSDYHLFRSLEHFLRDKYYQDYESVQNDLDLFFQSKSQSFYRDGIRKLPDLWRKVIDSEGDYFD